MSLSMPSAPSFFGGRLGQALLCALLLAWLLAFCAIGYPWRMVGFYSDSLVYLHMADAFRNGIGDPNSAFGTFALRYGRFPPGYPLYLSLLGAHRSLPGLVAANLAQMASVLAMLAVCYGYLRSLRLAPTLALGGVLYLTSLPFIHPWALELTSEPLFTALLVGACWIANRASELDRAWLWAAVLIALACLVRTLGVVALPALAVHTWLATRSVAKTVTATLVAATPIAFWLLYQNRSGQSADLSYLGSLTAGLAAIDPTALQRMLHGLAMAFGPRLLPSPVAIAAAAALLLLALPQLRRLAGEQALAAGCFVSILATLLVWPYPDHLPRLLGPLAPLLTGWAMQSFGSMEGEPPAHRRRWGRGFQTGLKYLFVATMAVGFVMSLSKLVLANAALRRDDHASFSRNMVVHFSAKPQEEAERLELILQLGRDAHRHVEAGACMAAVSPPLALLLDSGKVRSMPQPFSWNDSGCDYAMAIDVSAAGEHTPPMYPLDRGLSEYEVVLLTRTEKGKIVAMLIKRKPRP